MLFEATSPSPESYDAVTPPNSRHGAIFPTLTANNLGQTLFAEQRPVAVLCGAAWAAPYRAQHSDLAALSRATDAKFAFYTLDALQEEELAAWIKVRVLPTTLVFRGGQIVARFAGYVGVSEIQSALTAAAFPSRGRAQLASS